MTTSERGFDENLLLAQLDELAPDEINKTDITKCFKNVEQLLNSFHDLNLKRNHHFDSNFTRALFKAVDSGHLKVLKWLKEHNFNVIVNNVRGYTVLHRAAEKGQSEIVDWQAVDRKRHRRECQSS